MATQTVILGILLFVLIPLWVVAGFADWLCHRASRIEHTTGVGESILHLLMLAEAGTALLCGLFLAITPLTLAIIIGLWALHELTSFRDLRTATGKRPVSPFEQHVHGYLLILPLTILSFTITLNWDDFISLVSLQRGADYSLRLKDPPLPVWYLIGLPTLVVLLNGLPYLEELVRGYRRNIDPS